MKPTLRIVAMSDSHNQHRRLPAPVPDGDVFVHAGDFGCTGRETDVRDFGAWVRTLPHRHKIVVAGNHDVSHDRDAAAARTWIGDGFTYLQEAGVEVDGLVFWGSPYTPAYAGWAFGLPHGEGMRRAWDRIPPRVDVLITHGPPHGVLDLSTGNLGPAGTHVGCEELRRAVDRVRPRLHVFGHVHGNPGDVVVGPTRFVNVAVVDDPGNKMTRGCVVIDLETA